MRDYIILNGVNSNTITGLLISKLPPITKPKIRTQTEEIDGRDGDIVTKLGYSAYDKELEIGLYGDFDIDDVIAYFNSEGTVTFSNEPDKFYNYQILDQIDYEKLIRFKKAKVRMHVQPFKYPLEEIPVEITIQTVNDEGEAIDLDNTKEAPMTIALKGNGGKNLLPINQTFPQTRNGLTYSILDNGKMTIKGTCTGGDSVFVYNNGSITLPAGTYTLSKPYNSSGTPTLYVYLLPGYKGGTFTLTEETTFTSCYIYISSDNTGNTFDLTYEPMLVKGNTLGDYEPYGASVTGDNTIEVVGKNLLNPTLIKQQTAWNKFTMQVQPNTQYTISANFSNDGKLLLYMNNADTYGASYQAYTGHPVSITTDNSGLIYIMQRTTDINVLFSNYNIQLEKGNQATTYEEYKGASYPINLGDIELNTGDSIQFITDKWYIVRANETQEEITDATLIEQLNTLDNATSYDTKTHISQTNDSKPFILNATAIQQGSGEATVNNEGNIYSKPTLDIEGSGTVGIYLDGNQIFSIDLSNSSECVIDTTQLEAYNPTTSELMNRQVTGDYSNFKLNAGDNQIQATGEITKVTISNYTRWL